MNIDKFTQKSIEAVNGCEKLAMEYGNQEIEQEHLLYSLLTLDDSLILKLVEKMEIQKDHFVNRAKQALEKRVKVQGGQPYVGQYLNKVLVSASDEAKQMGDEYVSVEHLFLAMIRNPNKEIAEIWKEYGITRERFLQALSTVRGNQRVTSDNPEATYDTLEKYGQYRDTKVHDYSFVKMGHGIMLICSYQEDNIPEDYQSMLHHINDILVEAGFLPESYHIGICDEILPLDCLNEAIIKSKNANIVGQFFEQTDTAYSQIGIYKYVMSLVNNPMLYHEVEESVSILQKYDASHDVNLLETVISYVKNNGDFAKTSEELFQHSNTVRYRIRKAEQLLGLPDFATAEEMALIIRCYLLHNVMTLND